MERVERNEREERNISRNINIDFDRDIEQEVEEIEEKDYDREERERDREIEIENSYNEKRRNISRKGGGMTRFKKREIFREKSQREYETEKPNEIER